MGSFFGSFDILLSPTLGRLPARLGVYDPIRPTQLRELFEVWSPLESFLPAFNATGQPAISLPLHTSEDGLPIGMQLIGAFGSEALLLRLAAHLERLAVDGGTPSPHRRGRVMSKGLSGPVQRARLRLRELGGGPRPCTWA